MTKKILAVVVALAVMVTACSMMAFAAETPTDVVEIYLQLEPNGAQGKMDDILANDEGVVVVPEHAFTNDNYNFMGWNTTADGAGDSYAAGDEITLKETMKLYAQWQHKDAQIIEYTITYDANGGTGETLDEFGPYIAGGYAYTAYNNFKKAGATFLGWNTAKDGSGTSYIEDEMFEIESDLVLYAMWEGGEEIVDEPSEDETVKEEVEVEEVVTETDNPETGSSSVAGVVVAGVVALGALVVLKKRD